LIHAVNYVKEKKKITNKDYREEFNISERTASRELGYLVKNKVFKQIGFTGKDTTN